MCANGHRPYEILAPIGAGGMGEIYRAWDAKLNRDIALKKLYLERGADPVESDAEPWATPLAWAKKKGHPEIEVYLRQAGAR